MECKVNYILLEDTVLLSKKEYADWREIQDEFYDTYKANLGPWTYEELISYLQDDFGEEETWPFSREAIMDFFGSDEMILYEGKEVVR